jgi:Flp pilus assembly protein TadD
MALLFASLPLSSRLLLGSWDFEGAFALAFLCFAAGCYFRITSRRFVGLRDPASMIDHALQLAASGRTNRAVALLTRTIQLSPSLWQAHQYRGEIYLSMGSVKEALDDFDRAIGLAPAESNLYALRGYAHARAGDSFSAAADYEMAARLNGRGDHPSILTPPVAE